MVNGIIHSNYSQYYKKYILYEICKLGLKNVAFHLMLASLLLFPAMCLLCDADSTPTALKPTKKLSLLFAKQFFILPLHCWDLPVIAFPWQWIGFPGTNNNRLKLWSVGSDSSTPLAWSFHSVLPTCRALLGGGLAPPKLRVVSSRVLLNFTSPLTSFISGTKLH